MIVFVCVRSITQRSRKGALVRVGQTSAPYSITAGRRPSRPRVTDTKLGTSSASERHIIAVNEFGTAGVAENFFNLSGFLADDLAGLIRVIGYQAAA